MSYRNKDQFDMAATQAAVDLYVPPAVLALFVHQLCDHARIFMIEPRQGETRGSIAIDHHMRTMGEMALDLGWTTATLIAASLISNRVLTRRAVALHPTFPDADQHGGAVLIDLWNKTGNCSVVLRALDNLMSDLLKEEFWMFPQAEVLQMVEAGPVLQPEHLARPAAMTLFEKHGCPPILYAQINSVKQSFGPSPENYANYIRQLAIAAGLGTQTGLVFVQTHYKRAVNDSRNSSGILGVIGSYPDDWRQLPPANPLSQLFMRYVRCLSQAGCQSRHDSSRNMLTVVKPSALATVQCEHTRPDPTSDERTSARYFALQKSFLQLTANFGYVETNSVRVENGVLRVD